MRYSSNDESGLTKVLSLLKSHNTEYLSGQDLSDVLKISRVAVWKHIKNIKKLGYKIESKQKMGYKLKSDTEELLPWEVTSELNTKSIGKHIYYFKQINSTQAQAIKMAANNAEEGTLVIARRQSEGRGRNGREWISPDGGIWLSVILRPRFDISSATLFPMAAALALATAIKKTLNIHTEMKWPNDLTLKGKKVAGILVDISLESNRIENMVLGVGINYNIDVKTIEKSLSSTLGFYGSTSLTTKVKKIKPKILVQAFLEELEAIYDQMGRAETKEIIKGWTKYSSTIGKNVKVDTTDGRIVGRAVRIDDDGALVISNKNKTVRIMAGDVAHV